MLPKKQLYVTVLFLLLAFWSVHLVPVQGQTLSITKVLICSAVSGYGRYVERSSTINLGEVFYAYIESVVPGTWNPNGKYSVKMRFMLDITDPLGMTTQSTKSNVTEQEYSSANAYSPNWYWSVSVNSSLFNNYIDGNYLIKAGVVDLARNVDTSAYLTFTLRGAFSNEVVFNVNRTIVLSNKLPSSDSTVTMLRLTDIGNVGSYQTVLDGPRTNIQPEAIGIDDYGNRYILYKNLRVAPGSKVTIVLSNTVSIKMAKVIIGNEAVPFSTLQDLPPETKRYLEPTQYIEPANPVFKQIVNAFREKSADVRELVYQLDNFTANHITYDFAALKDSKLLSDYGKDSAFSTYTKGKGVCTNFSRLLVALLRAAGIPARTVEGLGFINRLPGRTYNDTSTHEWVNLYLPGTGWIPVEPQLPRTLGYTLSSHIPFAFSPGEYSVMIDGYNGTISDYYDSYSGSITVDQYFIHVAAFSYNGKPCAQYEIIRAQTVTSGTTTRSIITSATSSITTTTSPISPPIVIFGLAILALPFIGIIGVIVFVVRRRRARRTGGAATEVGVPSKPSPAPVPTAVGTKFCMECGVRIPVTARFCGSCGAKQD